MRKITIAIDGFSSCGKSTMAKDLAKEIGYIYIDSGAMYRAVTLYCLRNNLFNDDIRTLRNGQKISIYTDGGNYLWAYTNSGQIYIYDTNKQ